MDDYSEQAPREGDAQSFISEQAGEPPRNEDLLAMFVQHMPAAGVMLDTSYHYVVTSSRWRTDYALSGIDLEGASHFDLFDEEPGQWRSIFASTLMGTVEQGNETPLRRTNGALYWVQWEVRPWYSRDGSIGGLILFTEDRTERRKVQQALQVSQDVLSGILTSSLDGIMSFTTVRSDDGEVEDFEWLVVNPMAAALLGHAQEDLVGAHLLDVLPGHKDLGLFEAYVHVAQDTQPFETEVYYDRDGLDIWLQVAATRLSNGVAVTWRNITERKEAEAELARTNAELKLRNRELQDFAYVASHDLQEPLRKIRAFADLLLEDYEENLDEMGGYYLERVQDSAMRMSRLIADLLTFSRVTTQGRPFAPLDLNMVVSNVLSDLQLAVEDAQADIQVDPLPVVEADVTQMHQLFQNLIGNALKFRMDDRDCRIQVSATSHPHEGPPSYWVLQVRDNGIGFDEKYLDRIFSPFQRLHGRGTYPGTGMGLAICRRIVERHEGTLKASSAPGEGAVFEVSLPVRH